MICLFENAKLSKSAIERLQMRVVLMERGMYDSRDEWFAVHGSGNATERGLLVNGEQMSVDRGTRAWMDGEKPEKRVRKGAASCLSNTD